MTHSRRFVFFAFLASIAGSAAVFSACGGDTPVTPVVTPPVDTTPPAPVVASVTVIGPSQLLTLHSDSVRATAQTSAGVAITGKVVTWSSSNTAAVTVTSGGVLNAVAPGTATISASVDGIVGTKPIVVTDASLVTLAITGPTAPLLTGVTTQLALAGKDSANAPVVIRATTWTTTNANVATVSPTGLVTARAPGTATIKVEGITNTAIFAQITITVVPVPVASIVIANTDSLVRFRFPTQVLATARDSAGNVLPRTIIYTSSDVDVATLDDFGLATATGRGTVTITASADGKQTSKRFFVPPDSGLYVAAVGGVVSDPTNISFDIPNATSPATAAVTVGADGVSRTTFTTSSAPTYRVRASTSADPVRGPSVVGIALLLGMANSGPVTLAPPSTLVSLTMKPYTATIVAPATAAVNTAVTVSWTFDETTQPFSFFPDRAPTGRLYYSTTNGPDLSGTPVAATTVTRDPITGISTFSATFVAPPTPGPLYIQVVGDGAVATLLSPIAFAGQALKVISIQ
jgi:hypothetical protein